MNRAFRHTVVVVGMAVAGTASANVTFYEGDNFGGREITVSQTVSNFDGTGFNDRARSAVVNDGQWEICVDANFSGGCQVLGPGRYPDLGGLTGRVSSVRPVSNPVATQRGEHRSRLGSTAERAPRCTKAAISPDARFSSAAATWRTWMAPGSTTARRHCVSKADIGSSAATPISAANVEPSVLVTTPRFPQGSTT